MIVISQMLLSEQTAQKERERERERKIETNNQTYRHIATEKVAQVRSGR